MEKHQSLNLRDVFFIEQTIIDITENTIDSKYQQIIKRFGEFPKTKFQIISHIMKFSLNNRICNEVYKLLYKIFMNDRGIAFSFLRKFGKNATTLLAIQKHYVPDIISNSELYILIKGFLRQNVDEKTSSAVSEDVIRVIVNFFPIIYENDPKRFPSLLSIVSEAAAQRGGILYMIANNFWELRKNNWEGYNEMLKTGGEFDSIRFIIKSDDVDKLQEKSISWEDDDWNTELDDSIFEYSDKCSLIQYAARCGAVKTFKFLLLNGSVMNKAIIRHAVIGGNYEILHIINQNKIDVFNGWETAVQNYQNDVFAWIMQNSGEHDIENILRNSHFKYNISCLIFLIDQFDIEPSYDDEEDFFMEELNFLRRINEDGKIYNLSRTITDFDQIFVPEIIPNDDIVLLSKAVATGNIEYIEQSCKIFTKEIAFINEGLKIYEEPLMLAIQSGNIQIFRLIAAKLDKSIKTMPTFYAQPIAKQQNDEMFKVLFEDKRIVAEYLRVICKGDMWAKLEITIRCTKDEKECTDLFNFAMIESMNSSALKCEEIIINHPLFKPTHEVIKASIHKHVTRSITLKLINDNKDKLIETDEKENLLQQATKEKMYWVIGPLLETHLFNPDEPLNSLQTPRIIAQDNLDAVITSIFQSYDKEIIAEKMSTM